MLPRESPPQSKPCRICGDTKALSEFVRDNSGKHPQDGYENRCKLCARARSAAYKEAHKAELTEKSRIYRESNPDKIREAGRRYEETHHEVRRAQDRNEYAQNPEAAIQRNAKWKEAHPDRYKASLDKYREMHRAERNEKARLARRNEESRQKHAEYEAERRALDPEGVRAQRRAWLAGKPGYEAMVSARRRFCKAVAFVENIDRQTVFERDLWVCGLCHEKVDGSFVWPDPRMASLDHIVPLAKGGKHSYDNVQLAHLRCNWAKRDGRLRRFKSLEATA